MRTGNLTFANTKKSVGVVDITWLWKPIGQLGLTVLVVENTEILYLVIAPINAILRQNTVQLITLCGDIRNKAFKL